MILFPGEIREGDEKLVIALPAKLFVKGGDKESWVDRGSGEVRMLRHKENQCLRLLMRNEETKEVIANHALDHRITLESNANSEINWVWSTFHFVESAMTETIFGIGFADTNTANLFKEKFIECQEEMGKLFVRKDKSSADREGPGARTTVPCVRFKTNVNETDESDELHVEKNKTSTDGGPAIEETAEALAGFKTSDGDSDDDSVDV